MTQAAVIIANNGGGSITVTNDGTSNSTTSIDLAGATIDGGTSITLNNEEKKTFYSTGTIIIKTGGFNSLTVNIGGVAYIEYCGSINISERLIFNTVITVTGENVVDNGELTLANANFALRMQSTAGIATIVDTATNAKYIIDTVCPVTLSVPTIERLVITGGDKDSSFNIDSASIALPTSNIMSTVSYNYAKPDGEKSGTGWLLSNNTNAALTYSITGSFDSLATITATDLGQVYTCGVECYGLSSLTSITVGNGKKGANILSKGIYGSNITLVVDKCNNLESVTCSNGGIGYSSSVGGDGGDGGNGNITISNCSALKKINCCNGGNGRNNGGNGGNGNITITNCNALTTGIDCYNGGGSEIGGDGGNGGTLTINNCQSINTINCSNGSASAARNGYATVILNNSFPQTANIAYRLYTQTYTPSTIILINCPITQGLSEISRVINTNTISKITAYYINSVTTTKSSGKLQVTIPNDVTTELTKYKPFLNKIDSLLSNISVKSVIFDLDNGTYSYQSANESGTFHKCSVTDDKFIVDVGGYFVFNGQMFANTTKKQIEYKFEQQ